MISGQTTLLFRTAGLLLLTSVLFWAGLGAAVPLLVSGILAAAWAVAGMASYPADRRPRAGGL